MRKQGDAPAAKRRAQGAFGNESIDAKLHGRTCQRTSIAKQSE
jgi:hypothetical protein